MSAFSGFRSCWLRMCFHVFKYLSWNNFACKTLDAGLSSAHAAWKFLNTPLGVPNDFLELELSRALCRCSCDRPSARPSRTSCLDGRPTLPQGRGCDEHNLASRLPFYFCCQAWLCLSSAGWMVHVRILFAQLPKNILSMMGRFADWLWIYSVHDYVKPSVILSAAG